MIHPSRKLAKMWPAWQVRPQKKTELTVETSCISMTVFRKISPILTKHDCNLQLFLINAVKLMNSHLVTVVQSRPARFMRIKFFSCPEWLIDFSLWSFLLHPIKTLHFHRSVNGKTSFHDTLVAFLCMDPCKKPPDVSHIGEFYFLGGAVSFTRS